MPIRRRLGADKMMRNCDARPRFLRSQMGQDKRGGGGVTWAWQKDSYWEKALLYQLMKRKM